MMAAPPEMGDASTFWMIYFAVDHADRTAAKITALGGSIEQRPMDIPATGRFAVARDRHGAQFAIVGPG